MMKHIHPFVYMVFLIPFIACAIWVLASGYHNQKLSRNGEYSIAPTLTIDFSSRLHKLVNLEPETEKFEKELDEALS